MQDFITTTDSITGLVSQGYIAASYDRLVEVFGRPNAANDGFKTDAEWHLRFNDGTLVAIYNYKDGKNYLKEKGASVRSIVEWHIGGRNKQAVANIQRALRNAT